jgi:NifB/MoaA-like Fe-S oxidoreductase
VEGWQEKNMEEYGSRVVYLADEFYIMAGLEMPDYSHYEDFPQIENGVGLVSMLRHEFDEYLAEADFKVGSPRQVSIATGVSPFKYIEDNK